MKCQTFVNMMDDLMDATLPPADHRRMAEHLKQCRDCREKIRSLRALAFESASLPRSVMPENDLWPGIIKRIIVAGPPERIPGPQPVHKAGSGWNLNVLFHRWGWRLPAVAVAGIVLILAATRLGTRTHISPPKRPAVATVPGPMKQDTKASGMESLRQPAPPPNLSNPGAETNSAAGAKIQGNAAQSCRCGPSAGVLAVIDEGWIVDESLTPVRRREIRSERLYNLAVENGDDFFLHKASLEARNMLLREHDYLVTRYRRRLEQHPGDPDAIYLYAYSLIGKNTPETIRLMRQLIADNPDAPWANLALAEVYRHFDYPDKDKVQTYLKAFMKLCPDSPEPIRFLISIGDPEFAADTLRRMRAILATRTDTPSLLLYQELWPMEMIRQAPGEDPAAVDMRIGEDLKRLRGLEAGRSVDLRLLVRVGYQMIGDAETARSMLARDTSYDGRWAYVIQEMTRDWPAKNPAPKAEAPAAAKAAYWESRLRMSDSWIQRLPEDPFVWIDRMQTLLELKNHPDSEFIAAGEKVLELERQGAESPARPGWANWGSNILRVASLYAGRGVRLDRVPALIKEGIAAAEKYDRETTTDLIPAELSDARQRFRRWQEADDAWQALAEAYIRLGRPARAREAIARIEAGLSECRKQVAQLPAIIKRNGKRAMDPLPSMISELAAHEARYRETLAQVIKAERR
ncbi:MAG: zf-HC2 domain-containing protein [Acidobacteriia bacterium]|nr:zf-HC2 domain-containing protein [Terriglobia bacterium]